MLSSVLAWLGSLLGGPFAQAAVSAYTAKLKADNSEEKINADLAKRELDVQQRELELDSQQRLAEIGRWYEPEHLFAYIMVLYIAKVVLWDKVFSDVTGGSTDPITGQVAEWCGLIMSFYVGRRGFENVARLLKNGK